MVIVWGIITPTMVMPGSNTNHKVTSWEAKFSEPVSDYIGGQTTLGFRYLNYSDINNDLGIRGRNNNYINHGIGSDLRDGQCIPLPVILKLICKSLS